MMDTATGQSKKYGFVRFYDQGEQIRAQSEMNGQLINGRAIRCASATSKNATPVPEYGYPPAPAYEYPPAPAAYPATPGADPAAAGDGNATVFVGGLDGNTPEETLHSTFSYFGQIKTCRVPEGKNCGFVEFVYPQSAEQAIATMHNQYVGSSQVRVEWGKSKTLSSTPTQAPAAAWPAQPDFSAQWQEYYAQQAAAEAPQAPQAPAPQQPAAQPATNGTTASKPIAAVGGTLDTNELNDRYVKEHGKFLLGVKLQQP